MTDWIARCPECDTVVGPLVGSEVHCRACGEAYPCVDGIWDFLRRERRADVERFLAGYGIVRRAEGRGSPDPAYYLALPDVPADDPLAGQWRMRKESWEHLRRSLLTGLAPGSRILDLGAGVGWLARLVTSMGHHALAVDLSDDDLDGLGAAVRSGPTFPCVRAEFARLPLAGASADVVVFNASFHYAADPVAVLLEAKRVLIPGGLVVVMDSPLYRCAAAGKAMVAERRADYLDRFGTASASLDSIEFLTPELLAKLSASTGVAWTSSQPWYGWRWWWRPYRARLRRRREPSRFVVLVGRFDGPAEVTGARWRAPGRRVRWSAR